jgi:hypothetical protein
MSLETRIVEIQKSAGRRRTATIIWTEDHIRALQILLDYNNNPEIESLLRPGLNYLLEQIK